jgi:hypothetical protein
MKDSPEKRSHGRRRLLIVACLGLLSLGLFWISRPRFDRRIAGTWGDGEHQMVIRDDGMADCFFGQYSMAPAGRIGSYWSQGPFQVRTSGSHFEFVRLRYDRTTLSGFLKYLLALVKRDEMETIEFQGTILAISDDAIRLRVTRQPLWDGPLLSVQNRQETAEYRRLKDVPFQTEPFRPADGPSTK